MTHRFNPDADPTLFLGRDLNAFDIELGLAAGLTNLDTLMQYAETAVFYRNSKNVLGQMGLVPATYLQDDPRHHEVVVLPDLARRAQEMVLSRLREEVGLDNIPEATQYRDEEGVNTTLVRWSTTYNHKKVYIYERRRETAVPDTTGLEVFAANYEPQIMTRHFEPNGDEQRRAEHAIQGGGSIAVAMMLPGLKREWEKERASKPPTSE